MFKLTEEEKKRLKSIGLNESDLESIENTGLMLRKSMYHCMGWAVIGLIIGYVLGKVF